MKNFNGKKIRTLRDLLSFLAILFIEFIIAFCCSMVRDHASVKFCYKKQPLP